MLIISEVLFILSLDDEGDRVESVTTALESVLAGAVLADLYLYNRIELSEDRVRATDQLSTEHPILDKALFDILDSNKLRKLKYWINTLTYKKLPDDLGQHLVEQNILVRKKKQLHLVIPYYDNGNQHGNVTAKYVVKNHLREIVLADKPAEMSDMVILAFLFEAELLRLVFTLGERKTAHKRIKKMIVNDEEESLLGETLDEIVAIACQPNG